jgi:glycine hydroxymethyltransferase
VPVFFGALGHTQSHQFAVLADKYQGGQEVSKLLRKSGFLACGIGLPVQDIEGDMNGVRFGTPELVRWGMKAKHSNKLAGLIAKALKGHNVSDQVSDWRRTFNKIHFVN